MSWDIYGNPLRRGHCEVHPHVHEEYPCSVCMQESQRRQYEQHQAAEYNAAMEREYYAHMEEEIFRDGAYSGA